MYLKHNIRYVSKNSFINFVAFAIYANLNDKDVFPHTQKDGEVKGKNQKFQ